jgi:hypothetical protein
LDKLTFQDTGSGSQFYITDIRIRMPPGVKAPPVDDDEADASDVAVSPYDDTMDSGVAGLGGTQ